MASNPGNSDRPTILSGFAPLASRYDVILSDVWGVLHDGITALPGASDTLTRFRAGGGTVVLLSNAPRPASAVEAQLDGLGVPRSVWDSTVTSGDLAREAVRQRPGQSVYHLGPARDEPLFAGLDVTFAGPEEADYVLCSGLFNDDTETVADYADSLRQMRARGLWMLCANPDIVVERGDRLVPCAGALAQAYEEMYGEVYYPGKPHRPVYEAALAEAARLRGHPINPSRVLALGDAIPTDIAGADAMGLDSLLIARGIHAKDLLGADGHLDPERTLAWLRTRPVQPMAVIPELVWGIDPAP